MPGKTVIVNHAVKYTPPPPQFVVSGIYWNALGPGQVCEVDNCGNPAYQICNKDVTCCGKIFHKGCGRKMCMGHCYLDVRRSKGKGTFLAGYNCKDTDCNAKYVSGESAKCKIVYFPFCIAFSVIILIQILALSGTNM